jgi:hypothetical protein
MVTPDYPPKDDVFQLASSLNYPLDFPQILARLFTIKGVSSRFERILPCADSIAIASLSSLV